MSPIFFESTSPISCDLNIASVFASAVFERLDPFPALLATIARLTVDMSRSPA